MACLAGVLLYGAGALYLTMHSVRLPSTARSTARGGAGIEPEFPGKDVRFINDDLSA